MGLLKCRRPGVRGVYLRNSRLAFAAAGGGAKESWSEALARLSALLIWAASVAYVRVRREVHLQERWRLRNEARD